jgi:4-alpha-glucanotransferase
MTEHSPVELAWTDAWGRRRASPRRATDAVLAAMQAEPGEMSRAEAAVALASRGQPIEPGELVTEDGVALGQVASVPRDLPYGYHRLRRGGHEQLLLVAPLRCPLPADLRAWGWVVQLYAARSERSWGIGDLGDLRRMADWSARLGAGALLVSPIGASNPAPDPEPSPYYPSSRRFRNPLYLALEEVPGYATLAAELEPLAREARALNARPMIDRARVQAIKLAALDRVWRERASASLRDSAVDEFSTAQGESLRQWCVFAALSEELGPGWVQWPPELRDPAGAAVEQAAARLADRVDFHAWLQWLLDRQLAAASRATPLIGDLPVGFDPAGFDAWAWQVLLAPASIGAPPDVFNPAGQRWGLPPFTPHRLRLAGYRPFVETIRSSLAHGGGLRIDHVLGLFRQWWVPDGADPADGAYVRQATDELLAVLAIESQRAGAIVIGEDLGTVAAGVRRRLASANVLSTRLGFFERRAPSRWPRRSLAALTTHDLPTVAGVWSGEDLADQALAGTAPNARGLARLRSRLSALAGVTGDAALPDVVVRAHAALGAAPSVLALATLEDAVLEPHRPNLPGTGRAQRDNWSRALPLSLERIERDPFVNRLARAIGTGRGVRG